MKWFRDRCTFEVKILPTLTDLSALAICISLGFWQLRRAEFKQQIQDRYEERIIQAPLTLSELSVLSPNDLDFYPVRVRGQFDNAHTILLDNKTYQGSQGYEVVTPFIPSEKAPVLLISRGWIPREAKREQLPKIEPIYGTEILFGYAKMPETKAFRLGDNIESDQPAWPLRIQQLDKLSMDEIAKRFGHPLYPFILLLGPEQPGELQRIWQPVVAGASKHHGYAVQWFLLAGVLGIFLVIVNARKK